MTLSINWYNVHGVKTMVPEYGLGKRVLWNLSFSVDKDSIQSNLWTIKRICTRTIPVVINMKASGCRHGHRNKYLNLENSIFPSAGTWHLCRAGGVAE